jgi:hypothetical protein
MRDQLAIVRWEKPPPPRFNGGRRPPFSRFQAIAEQLRARRGEWAVVEERPGRARGLAAHIRMGHMDCFQPAGDFDAVTRHRGGVSTTYARFVGDGEDGDV